MSTYAKARELIVGFGGAIRISIPAMTASQITALANKIDITMTVAEKSTPATEAASATETKYLETKLAGGGTAKTTDNSPTISVETGDTMSSATGDASVDVMEATLLLSYDDYDDLYVAWKAGSPLIMSMALGRRGADNKIVAWEHLFGTFSEFSPEKKDACMEVKVKVAGGKTYTAATGVDFEDFNTLITGSANKIMATNYQTEETLAAIVTGDFTNLLKGKIVRVAETLPALS